MNNPNLDLLTAAALSLTPLLDELVFVGGCMTGLLVTDQAAGPVRTTRDVDAIVEATSYAKYQDIAEKLRTLGFAEDRREGAPLCRWVKAQVILDVMPLDTAILGFSNRWYPAALGSSANIPLRSDLHIRAITAPYFVATKLDAFRGRGNDNYLASHDLEDLITVVDGRPALEEEIRRVEGIRSYVQEQFRQMLDTSDFVDALPGYLLPDESSQRRITLILDRLTAIADRTS